MISFVDWRGGALQPEQQVHCGLRGTDRIFHRKHDIVRKFAELSDEGEVLGAFRNDQGAIALGATQELAGDEGHHARDAGARFKYLVGLGLNSKVAHDLCHNLPARTC